MDKVRMATVRDMCEQMLMQQQHNVFTWPDATELHGSIVQRSVGQSLSSYSPLEWDQETSETSQRGQTDQLTKVKEKSPGTESGPHEQLDAVADLPHQQASTRRLQGDLGPGPWRPSGPETQSSSCRLHEARLHSPGNEERMVDECSSRDEYWKPPQPTHVLPQAQHGGPERHKSLDTEQSTGAKLIKPDAADRGPQAPAMDYLPPALQGGHQQPYQDDQHEGQKGEYHPHGGNHARPPDCCGIGQQLQEQTCQGLPDTTESRGDGPLLCYIEQEAQSPLGHSCPREPPPPMLSKDGDLEGPTVGSLN